MSVYKLYPTKDSTIYPDQPTVNTGLDQILEIIPQTNLSSRIVLDFDKEKIQEILDVINNVGTGYESTLKLYHSNIENLHKELTLQIHTLTTPWDMGVGREGDIPPKIEGVSWNNPWSNEGGDFLTDEYELVDEFKYNFYKGRDIMFDVTGFVLDNEGYIIKIIDEQEDLNTSKLKFYSRDSHTIYSPELIIKWDDSQYYVDEYGENLINNSDIILNINNKDKYHESEVIKFKVNVSEKYPPRTFTTEYLYQNKVLPFTSWYGLIDSITGEFLIPFDEDYTKISSDGLESYFYLDMYFLPLERYFTPIIKTQIDNEMIVYKSRTPFKVTN